MSDGAISIKLAPSYQMQGVQQRVDTYQRNENTIENERFYPDLSIADVRNELRIDGTVTTARLKDALIEAMASINAELKPLKIAYPEATELRQTDNREINGENVAEYRYKRAVKSLALANLYERYAGYDTTNDGERKMEMLQESIDQLRRDARFAVSDLLAIHRINVELI